mmetsp:Transcript_85080/g.147575  ORF Transcript_85080/g.147575 Transcript_85080/m.147575 type:complete len:151 (-) Transcript_85080:89-541(-)
MASGRSFMIIFASIALVGDSQATFSCSNPGTQHYIDEGNNMCWESNGFGGIQGQAGSCNSTGYTACCGYAGGPETSEHDAPLLYMQDASECPNGLPQVLGLATTQKAPLLALAVVVCAAGFVLLGVLVTVMSGRTTKSNEVYIAIEDPHS